MATKVATTRDVYNDSPAISLYNVVIVLGAATAETFTVPANIGWVLIEPTAAIWVNAGTTATVPAADDITGDASFRIAADQAYQCKVAPGQAISLIRESGAATVSIQCWDKP